MPRLTRKSILLARIESTYGTDSVPTGASHAILVRNLNITPINTEEASRDLIRPFLGQFDQLIANRHVQIEFEVEVAGAGTAGTAPGYGALLRACGLSETLLASPLTGTAQAGGASTITLAAGASSTDNAYAGQLLSITSGTGSGQSGIIGSYNGTTKVATMLQPWGVQPTGTSAYSIAASATYRPVSTAFESVSIYMNSDGTQHRMTGARGNVEFDFTAKNIPVMKFRMLGIFNTVADVTLQTPVYTAFQTPLAVNNTNTSLFRLHAYAGVLEQLSLNVNNSIEFRAVVGDEYIQLADRRSEGQLTIEAPTVAQFDIFAAALNNTYGPIQLRHGTTSGNSVLISSQRIDLGTPSYGDSQGIVTNNVPFYALPVSGNDEFAFTAF
jgi:hypothetical protein